MDMNKEFFNKRNLRFGSYSFVLTVIVVASAIILNVIVGGTKFRDKLKIDLTSNKLYSIGEKTEKVLDELDEKVQIIGLFDESKIGSGEYTQVMEFIKQYETRSNMIEVKYVDPDKNPGYIENELDPEGVLGINKYDFVVKSGKRSKVLSTYDIFERSYTSSYQPYVSGLNAEYAFTGAIRFVSSDNIPVIYYTEGHGEGDLETEFSELHSSLELNGYETKKINLASMEKIPDDAFAVMFISPQQDISTAEKEKLTVFMENGGNTIFLLDPIQGNPRLANLEDFLLEFNIGLGYDLVFELSSNRAAFGQPYYFMPYVTDNVINENLDPSKFSMFLINTRSIHILNNEKEWILPTVLLNTSPEAIGRALTQGEEDNPGPLNLAIAVENRGHLKVSKTLVIGNSIFTSDDGLQMDASGSGKKFMINSINWMQGEQQDIYIPVKKYTYPILEGITQQTLTILFIGLIIVVPLAVIGLGVFVWLRRRHL